MFLFCPENLVFFETNNFYCSLCFSFMYFTFFSIIVCANICLSVGVCFYASNSSMSSKGCVRILKMPRTFFVLSIISGCFFIFLNANLFQFSCRVLGSVTQSTVPKYFTLRIVSIKWFSELFAPKHFGNFPWKVLYLNKLDNSLFVNPICVGLRNVICRSLGDKNSNVPMSNFVCFVFFVILISIFRLYFNTFLRNFRGLLFFLPSPTNSPENQTFKRL